MSARKPTLTEQVAALTAAVAALTAAQAAPTSGASASGPARSADGRDFPCTAGGDCTRRLRSAARAAIHGVDAGGHEPRKA
jgi:hypothetical protein